MSTTESTPSSVAAPARPGLMLAMATLGFALNFWAWALISPLGPLFREEGTLGELSEGDVALLVAVPVIVGSLGRILVGALTDRYGGRLMFPVISGITIVPILFIAFFALDSYALLLVGGFFLGIAGTAFAVGVPFVAVHDRDAEPGEEPIPAESRLNALIETVVGAERVVVLEPDFEGATGVPGHKPQGALRRFADVGPEGLPEPLARAARLVLELAGRARP